MLQDAADPNKVLLTQAQGYYTVAQGQSIIAEDSTFRLFVEVAPNVWTETPQLERGVNMTNVQGASS